VRTRRAFRQFRPIQTNAAGRGHVLASARPHLPSSSDHAKDIMTQTPADPPSLGKPDPRPQDRYCLEYWNRDQNPTKDEAEGWEYFETEVQMKASGWESRCDATGRRFTCICRSRRTPAGGWKIEPPALRGRI